MGYGQCTTESGEFIKSFVITFAPSAGQRYSPPARGKFEESFCASSCKSVTGERCVGYDYRHTPRLCTIYGAAFNFFDTPPPPIAGNDELVWHARLQKAKANKVIARTNNDKRFSCKRLNPKAGAAAATTTTMPPPRPFSANCAEFGPWLRGGGTTGGKAGATCVDPAYWSCKSKYLPLNEVQVSPSGGSSSVYVELCTDNGNKLRCCVGATTYITPGDVCKEAGGGKGVCADPATHACGVTQGASASFRPRGWKNALGRVACLGKEQCCPSGKTTPIAKGTPADGAAGAPCRGRKGGMPLDMVGTCADNKKHTCGQDGEGVWDTDTTCAKGLMCCEPTAANPYACPIPSDRDLCYTSDNVFSPMCISSLTRTMDGASGGAAVPGLNQNLVTGDVCDGLQFRSAHPQDHPCARWRGNTEIPMLRACRAANAVCCLSGRTESRCTRRAKAQGLNGGWQHPMCRDPAKWSCPSPMGFYNEDTISMNFDTPLCPDGEMCCDYTSYMIESALGVVSPPPTPAPAHGTKCQQHSSGGKGQCWDRRKKSCSVPWVKGMCSGSSAIVCCTTGEEEPESPASSDPPSPSPSAGTQCRAQHATGECWDKTLRTCSVPFKAGLCPGRADVVCCPTGAASVGQGVGTDPDPTVQDACDRSAGGKGTCMAVLHTDCVDSAQGKRIIATTPSKTCRAQAGVLQDERTFRCCPSGRTLFTNECRQMSPTGNTVTKIGDCLDPQRATCSSGFMAGPGTELLCSVLNTYTFGSGRHKCCKEESTQQLCTTVHNGECANPSDYKCVGASFEQFMLRGPTRNKFCKETTEQCCPTKVIKRTPCSELNGGIGQCFDTRKYDCVGGKFSFFYANWRGGGAGRFCSSGANVAVSVPSEHVTHGCCPTGVVATVQAATPSRCKGECWDRTTATCSVAFAPGLCPGASNIMCCESGKPKEGSPGPSPPPGPSPSLCEVQFTSGACWDSLQTTCSAAFASGLCPGAANIRCCPTGMEREASFEDTCTGQCIDVGTHVCASGEAPLNVNCAGPVNRQCCPSGLGRPKAPPSPSPSPSPPPPSPTTCAGKHPRGGPPNFKPAGMCTDVTTKPCSGATEQGLCPGNAFNLCCTTGVLKTTTTKPPSPSPTTCASKYPSLYIPVGNIPIVLPAGQCAHVDACAGATERGLCSGGSTNVCCIKGVLKPKTPPPPPPPPRTTTVGGSLYASECEETYFMGQCWDTRAKTCSGGYRSGLCRGSSSNMCCPSGSEQANAPPRTPNQQHSNGKHNGRGCLLKDFASFAARGPSVHVLKQTKRNQTKRNRIHRALTLCCTACCPVCLLPCVPFACCPLRFALSPVCPLHVAFALCPLRSLQRPRPRRIPTRARADTPTASATTSTRTRARRQLSRASARARARSGAAPRASSRRRGRHRRRRQPRQNANQRTRIRGRAGTQTQNCALKRMYRSCARAQATYDAVRPARSGRTRPHLQTRASKNMQRASASTCGRAREPSRLGYASASALFAARGAAAHPPHLPLPRLRPHRPQPRPQPRLRRRRQPQHNASGKRGGVSNRVW